MACQRLFCLRWSQQELIMSRLIRPLHFCCPFPWLWATLSSGFRWCDGLWAPRAATCRLHWEWAKVHLVDQRDLLSTPRPRLSWHYKKQRDKRILSASISFRVLCAFGSLICLAHVDLRLLSNLWNQPHNRACLHTASWGLAVPCCTQGSLSVWEEGLGFHCSWALSEGGNQRHEMGMERAVCPVGLTLVLEVQQEIAVFCISVLIPCLQKAGKKPALRGEGVMAVLAVPLDGFNRYILL